jgi:glycine/D-amino acid oxidase-like deaminating enzyme
MSPPIKNIQNSPDFLKAVDVVVIGAGIVGSSAAYYAAKAGSSVALLEKGVVGCEQSSRNWGFVRQLNRDEREIPLAKHSLELWGELSNELGTEIGFRRNGLTYVTRSPQELATWEKWVRLASQYQVHSRVLTPDEAAALTPGCNIAWLGGVHCPTDGMAEPALAAPGIAEAAQRLGAIVHQKCAVRGLDIQNGRVAGVITEKGLIKASVVLCAGGAWSSMLLRKYGISFPQVSVRSTALYTGPAPEVTAGGISTPTLTLRRRIDGGYTITVRGRGRIELTPKGIRYSREFWPVYKKRRATGVSFGVGKSFFEGPDSLASWREDGISPFEKTRILDPAPIQSVVDEAMTSLVKTYPSLAGVEVAKTWGGWIDSTPDAIPVISRIDNLPGLVLVSGFSGHGFGVGPGAGRLAVDLALNNQPIVDPTPFAFNRFAYRTFGRVAEM